METVYPYNILYLFVVVHFDHLVKLAQHKFKKLLLEYYNVLKLYCYCTHKTSPMSIFACSGCLL